MYDVAGVKARLDPLRGPQIVRYRRAPACDQQLLEGRIP
jgi:hypothetical protein